MSWVETRKMTEDKLETWCPDETAEERAALAREIFAIVRDATMESIKSAPEILFVAAAGNLDTDVEFDESFPCGLDIPNLLVVGAVDRSGEPTGFTSFGRTVDVYANGLDVESVVPGGKRTSLSGTSISAPAATNLAAKILAVRPMLTPTEVIEIIKEGAKRVKSEQGELLVLNPLESMAMAIRE